MTNTCKAGGLCGTAWNERKSRCKKVVCVWTNLPRQHVVQASCAGCVRVRRGATGSEVPGGAGAASTTASEASSRHHFTKAAAGRRASKPAKNDNSFFVNISVACADPRFDTPRIDGLLLCSLYKSVFFQHAHVFISACRF